MSQRAERFAKLVQEELSALLVHGIKDPRVTEAGLVTITHVHVSDDLGVARVLVTLHGLGPRPKDGAGCDDKERQRALLMGLKSARPYFGAELGRRLKSKKGYRILEVRGSEPSAAPAS